VPSSRERYQRSRTNEKNIEKMTKGGRARWRIENETFNTLKNQGYEFEHNFGHGSKHLTTAFAYLMFLAFLIDQVQAFCCHYFKAAMKSFHAKIIFWEKLRSLFFNFLIESWDELYSVLMNHKNRQKISIKALLNTS
jgi:hypothetical protein